MKCRAHRLHERFKNGGIEMRATTTNFENHDDLKIGNVEMDANRLIQSQIYPMLAPDSRTPYLMSLTFVILIY